MKRCNIEETPTGIKICRGEHEKNAPCDWECFVPENETIAEVAALHQEIAALKAQIATAHTAAEMVWRKAQGEAFLENDYCDCPLNLLLAIGKQLIVQGWPEDKNKPDDDVCYMYDIAIQRCREHVEKFATIVDDEPVAEVYGEMTRPDDGVIAQQVRLLYNPLHIGTPLYCTPQLPEKTK